MTSLSMRLAIACVRGWTWLYTWRMPPACRHARRAEIESDLWEFQRDDAAGGRSVAAALRILLRLVLGMPDDLGWCLEQAVVTGTRTQGRIALSARVAGAALFVFALWAIDTDASRRRPAVAVADAPVVAEDIQGIITMGAGVVPYPAGRGLPLLRAGIVATVGPYMLPPGVQQSELGTASGPVFDVASVKPNNSGDLRSALVPQPGGRLTATNATAAALIWFAYDLPAFQVVGGPGWLTSDRFDVSAKADGDPPLEQKRAMLRRFLADRFSLRVHTETRELPIYALKLARSDGRMGTRLRRTNADCSRADQPSVNSAIGFARGDVRVVGSPIGPPPCGFFGFAPNTDLPSARVGLAFRGLTMAALAKTLVPIMRRSVTDQTGLSGYLDGDFDFIAELPLPPPPPGVDSPFTEPFVSAFTVLPEQLGLKLEPTRGPVEVLVIDSMSQPTPD